MGEINNQAVGLFVAQLRKEKGLTQRELAERLHISDKAVSKWERGLSLPDITLLIPLADCLGVTTTELLSARRVGTGERLDVREVEELVTGAIGHTVAERAKRGKNHKRWVLAYVLCAAAAIGEICLLLLAGFTVAEMLNDVLLLVAMYLIFGAWFCLGASETLPGYYDQNKINVYSDGIFRMNIPGVHFNNSNWPYILRAGRMWLLIVMVLFPAVYYAVRALLPPQIWGMLRLPVTLLAILGLFIPMMVAAKRHE